MIKKAFVSYARDDKAVVEPLVNDLKQLGCQVWIDQELSGGQPWWDRILQEIRDCEVFVLALTPRCLKSGACLAEFGYAGDLGKKVLPVQLLDLTGSHQPPAIAAIQQIDYRSGDKSAVMKLVGALSRLEASPALPMPLPAAPPLPISYRSQMTERVNKPSLIYQEQLQLVMELRDNLRDPERNADAQKFLKQLKERPDCSRMVVADIERILAESTAQPNSTDSSVSPLPGSEVAAEVKPGLLSKIQSLIPALLVAGVVLAVGATAVSDALFGPQIQVKALDFDWSPKPVVVGKTVRFTGRYELTYRIRKGWTWDREDVKGTSIPDVYTALWTIGGQTQRVDDARVVVTGETAQASFDVTFDRPGLHSVEFDIRSGKSRSSDEKQKIPTQNITVLAPAP